MTLEDTLEDRLDSLIPVINKLQDSVFSKLGYDSIDLPQIVVVGSQSSGKSSILESIVGKEFLPRGSDIVTRRPLILQLVNVPLNDSSNNSTEQDSKPIEHPNEYAELLHLPGKKFTDFELVCQEILNETSRLAGSNKGINRVPINLKIYSPNVLDLSLVDLPGMAKIPVGDQPADIEKQIRTMILDYIAKPNSIILAVTPANQDLVNSDGLKLARQVDPRGERTIGVLTKIDLMDKGTNARDILAGRVYPLKLGFVATINRSQLDIEQKKTLHDALLEEEQYFQESPIYKSYKCGTKYLAKLLNKILLVHIRERLPEIKTKLLTLINETNAEYASYGSSQFSGEDNQGAQVLQLITKFSSAFTKSIDGTSSAISTKELYGGARIYNIFDATFGNALKIIDPSKNLSIRDVRTAIRNSAGPRTSLFVPELAFELLIKPQIQLLRSPSQRCVDLVYEELIRICHSCNDPELERYPHLHDKLVEVVSDLLRERLKPTTDYINSLIEIQCAYINTNHPEFDGGSKAIAAIVRRRKISNESKDNIDQLQDRTKTMQINEKTNSASNGIRRPSNNAELPTSASRGTSRASASGENKEPIDNFPNSTSKSSVSQISNKDSFLTYFFGTKELSEKSQNKRPIQFNSEDDLLTFPILNDDLDTFDVLTDENNVLSEKDELEAEFILYLITTYFNIVRKSIQDLVPKAIMHLLVNYSKQNAQNRLVSNLYKNELFSGLLEENENLKIEKEKCKKTLELYEHALQIVSEVL